MHPIFGAGKHTSKSCDTELPTTDFAFLYSRVDNWLINFNRKSFEIKLSETWLFLFSLMSFRPCASLFIVSSLTLNSEYLSII